MARHETLFRVSRAINVYRDPEELFRNLAKELRQVVDFDFIALFLYDETANKVQNAFLETLEGPEFVIPSDFPAEETITWWVYQHQEPVLIASWDEELRFPMAMELHKRYGVESACILPLTTAYRRLGSLCFGARHPGAYSSNEIRYLSLVAEQVALAVDNALRDQEQRRAELYLEEGQKLSHTGSWHWDLASGEIKWSREHFRILSVDPDHEKPSLALFWSLVHPEDRALLEKAVDQAVHEKADFEEEYRIVVPDGTVKYIRGIGRAVLDESGELIEFIGTTMDITERKRGEDELRRQKAHFERLFELAPEAIVLRDFENRILRTNREFTELFGYTVEEALGRNINDLIVPDGSVNESEALRDALECGERVNAEVVRKRKDGSRLDVSFVAAPVCAEGDRPEIYGIYRDITERKQAEEALKRRDRKSVV